MDTEKNVRAQWKIISTNFRSEIGIGVSLIVFFVVLCFLSPYFLTSRNLSNVVSQVAIIAILSIGQTFIILTGGIDLSVGSVMGLAGMVGAWVTIHGHSVFLGIIACLIAGLLVGAVNGVLVGFVRLPAFIVTCGMLTIARNVDFIISGGRSISFLPPALGKIHSASLVDGLPYYYFGILALYLVASWMLTSTKLGRYTYALGSNENAARLSGINIRLQYVIPYVISGLMCGLAGVVLNARFLACDPNYGTGNELDTIAAVVLGGTVFTGGKGTLIGTIIGVFLMGFIRNGLDIMGVSPYIQGVTVGAVIILALVIEKVTSTMRKD
jgi:ribose transport system permease protein